MLGEPDSGWSEVRIGTFKRDASYLTCVPLDCLEACIHRVRGRGPLAFVFEAEGPGRFFVIADNNDTVIKWEEWNDKDAVIIIPGVNDVQLVLEIVNDIEEHIKDWCNNWDYTFTEQELTLKLKALKRLLPTWREIEWLFKKSIKNKNKYSGRELLAAYLVDRAKIRLAIEAWKTESQTVADGKAEHTSLDYILDPKAN